jgi:hypothetical protein
MLREKKKHEEGLPSEARSKRHTSSAEAVGKAVSPNKTVAANDERARSCLRIAIGWRLTPGGELVFLGIF